ncbi:phosphatase PAP2 family protein [Salinithrix halophila]|uniref:Phosphatase PAP2 family protein n=1 Tax=Salinithrix halophila TaxID=1485204 RepID=A0ABV8JEU8_9BACL
MKKWWPLLIGMVLMTSLTLTFVDGFLEIAEEVTERESRVVDQSLIQWTATLHTPALTGLMKGVTELGSVWWLTAGTVVTVVFLLQRRKIRYAMVVMVGMAGTAAMNMVLKNAYARARPEENPMVQVDGYSFPSGHAMGSIAFYGLLWYLTVKSRLAPRIKGVLSVGWVLLILLIGWSRIYLGVHYPTDVAAGYMAGAIMVFQSIAVSEGYRHYKRKREKRAL